MEEKVKQRLIGVIVIIGALFIILPFLFHNSRPSVETKIASNISNPTITLALPASSSTTATATPATTQNVSNVTTTAETTATVTAPAAVTTPNVTSGTISESTPTMATTPDATATTADMQTSAAPTTTATSDVNTQIAEQTPVVNTTAVTQTPAVNTQPAAITSAAATADSFTQAPDALTTGQANEGPVPSSAATQPITVATQTQQVITQSQPQAATQPVAMPKKVLPVKKKRVVAKHHEYKSHAKVAVIRKEAWIIQLGVFSDRDNAKRLISTLRQHHLKAYSRDVRLSDSRNRLMVVYVGPEINYKSAELLKNRLRHEFHLNGEIRKHG